MENKWYAVNVVNGKEKSVKEHIEKILNNTGLKKYIHDILIPYEKTKYVKQGKSIVREKSFLQGYIFINCEINGELERVIRGITNVKSFVGAKGKPEPIPQSEMNNILLKIDKNLDIENEEDFGFLVGEKVKICDGPFKNFDATIQEVLPDKKRLKVSVKIFGRDTLMEVNTEQVGKSY